jgi:rhodanese-related sulfurtransferase
MDVKDIRVTHSAEDSEWMMSMLQSPTFLKLPAANIQRLFERLQEMPVKAGQLIIRQGDAGEHFYLLKKGSADVTRVSGTSEIHLATLNPPQGFGEDALLSEQPRNANVRMQTDGVLMLLAKKDFQDLLREPLVNWVDLEQASALVREGAVRVDVRTEQEFEASSLGSALNIPLYLLRLKLPMLDKQRKYVLFCDTGTRSAAAAFLLSEHGFNNVSVLRGGLAALPD